MVHRGGIEESTGSFNTSSMNERSEDPALIDAGSLNTSRRDLAIG